jgi:hypothetical protein
LYYEYKNNEHTFSSNSSNDDDDYDNVGGMVAVAA